MTSTRGPTLSLFTDCSHFINGHCKLSNQCRYRHSHQAAAQTNNCTRWPHACRDVECPYRHPAPPRTTSREPQPLRSTSSAPSFTPREHVVSFFWDIENVPIPRGQRPFDIIQRIRERLSTGTGLRENSFSCFCNSTTISKENQLSLSHANVRIIQVPDRKPGAVDRQIMLELDRFERNHRPPATLVLISGDIDFIGKLSDLRHQAGFQVIVIHNRPAKNELKATVNSHYPWELFTGQPIYESPLFYPEPSAPPLPYPTVNAAFERRSDPPPRMKTHETKRRLDERPERSITFASPQTHRQHQTGRFLCEQCNRHFPHADRLNQHRQATGHLSRQTSNTGHLAVDLLRLGIGALAGNWPKLFD